MAFPPEIRNMIYKHALGGWTVRASRRKRKHRRASYEFTEKSHRPNVSLPAVSKQVRTEAASILYGCNKFEFKNMTVAEEFLLQIKGQNRIYLTHISIKENIKQASKAVGTLLVDAERIRGLQLGLFSSTFRRHVPTMKKFIADFWRVLCKIKRHRTQTEFFDVVEVGSVPVCGSERYIPSAGERVFNQDAPAIQQNICNHEECKVYRAGLDAFNEELRQQKFWQ